MSKSKVPLAEIAVADADAVRAAIDKKPIPAERDSERGSNQAETAEEKIKDGGVWFVVERAATKVAGLPQRMKKGYDRSRETLRKWREYCPHRKDGLTTRERDGETYYSLPELEELKGTITAKKEAGWKAGWTGGATPPNTARRVEEAKKKMHDNPKTVRKIVRDGGVRALAKWLGFDQKTLRGARGIANLCAMNTS